MCTIDDWSAVNLVNTAVALQTMTELAEDSQEEQELEQDVPSFACHCDQLQSLNATRLRFSAAEKKVKKEQDLE